MTPDLSLVEIELLIEYCLEDTSPESHLKLEALEQLRNEKAKELLEKIPPPKAKAIKV